jgi:excisionase family DNA binding protein
MNIVSFSGGKDSTAMLLMMLAQGTVVDEVIFCDTGMEFPAMYDHIKEVEAYTNKTITVLRPEKSYKYLLGEHVKKDGGVGYGHPDFKNRWCTSALKVTPFNRYTKKYRSFTQFHGIAFDESHRAKNRSGNVKYPLVEWQITEKQALDYCYSKGFYWSGLYEKFSRLSCWCCPLSRIGELKTLWSDFPELWLELEELDKLSSRRFSSDYTLDELKKKFAGGTYKTDAASKYIGVSATKLKDLTNKFIIPTHKTARGHRRFNKKDLDNYLERVSNDFIKS